MTDSAGKAAQTGSAVGRVIELWHRGHLPEDAYRQVEREACEQWPMADLEAVVKWGAAYFLDPRNGADSEHGVVIPELCEAEVSVELPPAPEDETGEPVVFKGHVDQVRRGRDGVLRVWDIKSGRGAGLEMLASYAMQLAGYVVAGRATWGDPVLPGGIIRLRGYDWSSRCSWERGDFGRAPAFFASPWDAETCVQLIGTVVQHVAWLRNGMVHLQPGTHCLYCPGQSPHLCGQRIGELDGV